MSRMKRPSMSVDHTTVEKHACSDVIQTNQVPWPGRAETNCHAMADPNIFRTKFVNSIELGLDSSMVACSYACNFIELLRECSLRKATPNMHAPCACTLAVKSCGFSFALRPHLFREIKHKCVTHFASEVTWPCPMFFLRKTPRIFFLGHTLHFQDFHKFCSVLTSEPKMKSMINNVTKLYSCSQIFVHF